MLHLLARVSVSCESIMARATGCTFKNVETHWWFCFVVETKARKHVTSKWLKSWQKIGVIRMTEKLTTYDPAAALVNDEEIAFFMADALETGDAAYIAKSLGVVARAKGMAQIAADTGLSRAQLYRSFSEDGNPTLKTTLAVMKSLGLWLTAKQPRLA
jgi:probable addiction module antidote protein